MMTRAVFLGSIPAIVAGAVAFMRNPSPSPEVYRWTVGGHADDLKALRAAISESEKLMAGQGIAMLRQHYLVLAA